MSLCASLVKGQDFLVIKKKGKGGIDLSFGRGKFFRTDVLLLVNIGEGQFPSLVEGLEGDFKVLSEKVSDFDSVLVNDLIEGGKQSLGEN